MREPGRGETVCAASNAITLAGSGVRSDSFKTRDGKAGSYAGPVVKAKILTTDKSYLCVKTDFFRKRRELFRHQIDSEAAQQNYGKPK